MILNQNNKTILTPPFSQKKQEMNNIPYIKIQPLSNGEQGKMNFLQEQGEEADNDISLLYNEIFQNPMETQNQGLMNIDESQLNDSLTNTNIAPLKQDTSKLSVNNTIPFNNVLLNNPVRNNIKNSIPSPMNQTPFLHPMFSTPTYSYLNSSTMATSGVSSPLFEFTPPSTPPHTRTNGSSKLKNIYKPSADSLDTMVESSPLLCSDYFMTQNGINKQIATTLENENNLTVFSPALNLPMKKLALFSPNGEDTAITDIYPSSYNYLDDPIVNSPLLPIQDEQATTSSLLPLYNTGMYDVQSPFLMEKPDEGYEVDSSMVYNEIDPNIAGSSTSFINDINSSDLLKTGDNVSLNQVSPLLMNSPYLTDQDNVALNQSPFLPESVAPLTIKDSPFINEQSQIPLNSPYVGEQPIITLNDSPCLPEQVAGTLRKKTTSPLLMDPRYAVAYSKGLINQTNPAYFINKKRKLGVMNYPYGPIPKIQRIQGKERSALEEISSGFLIKNDSSTIKPSPLLQESSIDIEPVENAPFTNQPIPVEGSSFLNTNPKINTVKITDSLDPALITPNTTPSPNTATSSFGGATSQLPFSANKMNKVPFNDNAVANMTSVIKQEKIEKNTCNAEAQLLPPKCSPTTQILKEYSDMMLNNPSAMLATKIQMPTLVSMAGIKLDTKAARATDNEKGSKSKTTKTTKATAKKGRRSNKSKAVEIDSTKANVNSENSEFMDVKVKKAEASAMDTNGFLVPQNTTTYPNGNINPSEEMDYHDIPTIKLGNTPNIDMLSPASLGISVPNSLNSPLLKPLSFNLNSNIQLVKKRAKKKYPCTYPGCVKSFSRPCHRQSHERSHENSRPFECPECKRAFCRKHDMIRHQRIHSKERPYQCKICKRKFARGDALVRHRTRPTSSCYQADMAFAKKIRQQQHRILQQQQQLEYERLQKEKQLEAAAAAAATSSSSSNPSNSSDTVPAITVTPVGTTTPVAK
ncbi:hypothetical protein BCR36DRAFT_416443 [Piromyces finnis]|uniref:C2H2-type domain-containing protein n=1 Tax=Piromyces finnis TaxID=1754191 RepID=A0A1Y1UXG1_9FUNG|nr:hypothetical protein BCR36DRAFT_416443 [Piromyces finnis]|eukprot:ORX41914.1 hypothetical protein BCR36DRAFT_416443 [Piromyces finnis]